MQVTDKRKSCMGGMPFDGTLDVWVILFITGAACRPAPPLRTAAHCLPIHVDSLNYSEGILTKATLRHVIIQYSSWRSLWTTWHNMYKLVP